MRYFPGHFLTRSPFTGAGRSFALLWSGASLSYLAFVLTRFLLPVLAATVSRDPVLISGIAIAQALPWLVCGLVAGTLVDRRDRRQAQVAMNGLRLAALVVLTLAIASGRLSPTVLVVIAVIIGTTDVFIETSQAALVPAVAGLPGLARANGRLFVARTSAEIVATPLAGVLLARDAMLAPLAAAVFAGLALVCWRRLGGSYQAHDSGQAGTLLRQTGDGIRFLWRQPVLRTITILAAVINACLSAWATLLVLYAIAPGPLGLSPVSFGALLTFSGLGGLAGSLAVGWLVSGSRRRFAFSGNIGVNATMFAVTALTANPWLVAPALFFGDSGGPLWGIATLSVQAEMAPDAMRGRVASAYRFVSLGAMAVGPAIGGAAAGVIGVQGVFLACAVMTGLLIIPCGKLLTAAALTSPAHGEAVAESPVG